MTAYETLYRVPIAHRGNASLLKFSILQWSSLQWSSLQWSSLQWSSIHHYEFMGKIEKKLLVEGIKGLFCLQGILESRGCFHTKQCFVNLYFLDHVSFGLEAF